MEAGAHPEPGHGCHARGRGRHVREQRVGVGLTTVPAMGDVDTLILHWNGKAWRQVPSRAPAARATRSPA
jgi:hypothetical protein